MPKAFIKFNRKRCDSCCITHHLRTDVVLWETVDDFCQSWKVRSAGPCLGQVSLEKLQLGSKGLDVTYSLLTTASCPCRLTFSVFRCLVMSTEKAKSASNTESDSSSIGCSFHPKNVQFPLRERVLSALRTPDLSHLTSLQYITSLYST